VVASEAIIRLSRQPDGRAALAKVKQVRLNEGRKPVAQLVGGVMKITVAPTQGLAGRPSSERIVAAAR
jgi:hypothetical protein